MDDKLINNDDYYSLQYNDSTNNLDSVNFEDDYYILQNEDFVKTNESLRMKSYFKKPKNF